MAFVEINDAEIEIKTLVTLLTLPIGKSVLDIKAYVVLEFHVTIERGYRKTLVKLNKQLPSVGKHS